ncbi:hypothetical protein [Streptomyces sp. NPDC013455]|uniref:hypothetical protein n=1 Tax=Streptomyces sp. NPDC013455 TaxID=3155605 RepID=UPI0033E3477B
MVKLRSSSSAVVVAAVGVLSVSCADRDGDTPDTGRASSPHASSSSSARTPPSERAELVPDESVTGSVLDAPVLPDGKVVARAMGVGGGREMHLAGGSGRGPLSVLVSCQGEGKLTVRVEPAGLGFPLDCLAGEVSSTYDQVDLQRVRGQGAVSVVATSAVRWAVTVGREPAL